MEAVLWRQAFQEEEAVVDRPSQSLAYQGQHQEAAEEEHWYQNRIQASVAGEEQSQSLAAVEELEAHRDRSQA